MAQEAKCKRIMCVGMCVLDIIQVCETYPTEDTDKRCLKGYWQRGGNASNNCTVLRTLGAECEFLGMLSDSMAFKFLIDDNINRGIGINYCPHTENNPPFSTVILSNETGSRTIIHSNENFPILTFEHFQKANIKLFTWVHFEARNTEETIQMIIDINMHNACYGKKQIYISLDMEKLQLENLLLLNYVDYIFLGKDLAKYLDWNNGHDAVFGLREKINAQSLDNDDDDDVLKPFIICPWGASGTACLDRNDGFKIIKTYPPDEIVDSLGAGDTFCAATIYGIHILQMDFFDAVDFGNKCAGFKLGHRGYDKLHEFIRNFQ